MNKVTESQLKDFTGIVFVGRRTGKHVWIFFKSEDSDEQVYADAVTGYVCGIENRYDHSWIFYVIESDVEMEEHREALSNMLSQVGDYTTTFGECREIQDMCKEYLTRLLEV